MVSSGRREAGCGGEWGADAAVRLRVRKEGGFEMAMNWQRGVAGSLLRAPELSFGCSTVRVQAGRCRDFGWWDVGLKGSLTGKVLFGAAAQSVEAEHHLRGCAEGQRSPPQVTLRMANIEGTAGVHGRCGITAFHVPAVVVSWQEVAGSRAVALVGALEGRRAGGVLPRCCSRASRLRQMLVLQIGCQPRGFPTSASSQSTYVARHVDRKRTVLHPILVCSSLLSLSC